MTRVKILKTVVVYPDGVRPETYGAGDELSVTSIALAQLINQGAVEIVENKAIEAVPESKPVKGRKRAEQV